MSSENAEAATNVIDLLLQSTFSQRQINSRRHAFMFGKPKTSTALYNLGTEVFYSSIGLAKSALALREAGALYLRSLRIGEIESTLTDFLCKNYWILAPYVWGKTFEGPYQTRVPAEIRSELAKHLVVSQVFSPTNFCSVYPLIPISVSSDFVSQPFFLISPESLSAELVGTTGTLVSTQFPPISTWDGRKERPTSWLGIQSPSQTSAKRMRNVVLGAIALLPHQYERHMFTGRQMFGGSTAFQNSVSFSFSAPCTPALSENLVIGADDAPWLTLLAEKLAEGAAPVRRQMRALEYFYRAWPLPEVERFPILFMALDAVFGDASQHTQKVAESIESSMGANYDVTRLKLLMKMRAAVVHGGAPEVYDCSHYEKYLNAYERDPVKDVERIVAYCLQAVVFEGRQTSRKHTYADIIKKETGCEP